MLHKKGPNSSTFTRWTANAAAEQTHRRVLVSPQVRTGTVVDERVMGARKVVVVVNILRRLVVRLTHVRFAGRRWRCHRQGGSRRHARRLAASSSNRRSSVESSSTRPNSVAC